MGERVQPNAAGREYRLIPAAGQASGGGSADRAPISDAGAKLFDGAKDESRLLMEYLEKVRAGTAGPLPQEAYTVDYLLLPGLNWDLLGRGYFRPSLRRLRKLGLRARIVRVDPLASSAINAPIAASAIEGLENPAVILGHSYGGKHGKRALEIFPELRGRIRALVTLGTPHHGTRLADWFLPRLWLYDALMLAGRFLRPWRIFSTDFRFWHEGIKELSREHARPHHALGEDVPLFSVAGRLTRRNVLLRVKSRVFKELFKEDNDGVVAVRDAILPGSRYAILDNVGHVAFVAAGGMHLRFSGMGAEDARFVEDLTEAMVRWVFHERGGVRGPPRVLERKPQPQPILPIFKKAAAWGAAAAVLAPVLFHAAPALMALYAGLFALVAMKSSLAVLRAPGDFYAMWKSGAFGPFASLGMALLTGLAISYALSLWTVAVVLVSTVLIYKSPFWAADILRFLIAAAVDIVKLPWRLGGIASRRVGRKALFAAIAGSVLGAFAGYLPYAHVESVLEHGSKLILPAAAVASENELLMQFLPAPWQRGVLAMAMTERNMRPIGPAFGARVQEMFQENPRGRMLLDKMKDRAGVVRMPTFIVSQQEYGGMFYFPFFDAISISPSEITNRGWTVEQFLADPAKQMQLARDRDTSLFHEMVHAWQFRRSALFQGQLENFPRNFFKGYNVEQEHEAYIEQMLYVHEKLKADPYAEIGSNEAEYAAFLNSLDDFIKAIDEEGIYKDFAHIGSEEHKRYLADINARWPAISVEGYLLQELRVQKKAESTSYYQAHVGENLKKAGQRALEFGLPEPSLKDVIR